MKIKTRLWVGVGVAAAVAAVAAIVLFTALVHVGEALEQSRHMDGIVRSVFELKMVTVDYRATGLDRSRDQWVLKHDTLGRELNAFATDDDERRFVRDRMAGTHASLKRTFGVLCDVSGNARVEGDNGESDMLSSRLTAKMDACLLSLLSDANRLRGGVYAELNSVQRRTAVVVTLFALTMAGLIFGLAAMVNRAAIRPLFRLARATSIIADGDLAHRTGLTANDEVGQLSQSFDHMLDRLNDVMASRDALNREVEQRERAQRKLKRTLANLERSNRDLEQFAYSASHDLQEPLRKVMAFGSLLEKEYGEAVKGDGVLYIQSMQKATRRMQTLISDLLSYSRVSTRGGAFVPVDMNEVVNDVLSDLEIRIRETDARVEVEKIPALEADRTQMRQLLQNLIGNALKFHANGEKPWVRVSAVAAVAEELDRAGNGHTHCRLVVEDNGIGFENQYAERIFGVFQRLHGRDEYSGSGIGLAVCRRIAERHGGSITASGRPGEGATFVVTLPLAHVDEDGED